MKILYAIQGTGNGHISRARDIIPALCKKGSVDILISGTESDVEPGFPVKYVYKGLSFVFGKKGGVDLAATYKKARLRRFYNEIRSLPVNEYDMVVSDFEPVSAWACRLHRKPCLALSHQGAVLNKKAPQPAKFDPVGRLILKNYAPAALVYGFHFAPYDDKIFTPVIRSSIREITPSHERHYTVYLPAYSDKKIIRILGAIAEVQWQVFSKHCREGYIHKNISIRPVRNESFVKSMASAEGVLCGAGFETPAEALYLQKKLMVIPMKHQYEQQCNAAALKKMQVPVLKKLKKSAIEKIRAWISSDARVSVDYPDHTSAIVEGMINHYLSFRDQFVPVPAGLLSSFKKMRRTVTGSLLRHPAGSHAHK